jgi:hypothetical protein
MKTDGTTTVEVRAMLTEMTLEAREFKAAAGGSVTDAVAGWLGSQYLLAARAKLTATDGSGRFEVLRTFVQDWAMLRHGDHTAERLHIVRERPELSKQDTKKKWEAKIKAGLDEILEEVKHNSKLKAAFEPFREMLCAETDSKQEEEFREWLKRPEIRKEVFSELTHGLNPETLKKIKEELYLL